MPNTKDVEKRMMDAIPDEEIEKIRNGELTISESSKQEARAKKQQATAHSVEELFDMLGIGRDAYFSEKKAAILAFAARQPGSVKKLPDAWVAQLKEELVWPLNHELDCAIKAGEAIRDMKFIRIPGNS